MRPDLSNEEMKMLLARHEEPRQEGHERPGPGKGRLEERLEQLENHIRYLTLRVQWLEQRLGDRVGAGEESDPHKESVDEAVPNGKQVRNEGAEGVPARQGVTGSAAWQSRKERYGRKK